MKTDFPELIRRLKSLMKLTFVSSDGVLMVLFVPQWRITLVIVEGADSRIPGSFSTMAAVVAPEND